MPRARRILVIENNRSAAELLARIFEVDDYEVVVAANAESALVFARESCPDAVVLDLEDPRVHGRVALDAFRKDATLQRVPIIAVSDDANDTVDGADIVIEAPLDHDGLIALLHCVHGYAGLSETSAPLDPVTAPR